MQFGFQNIEQATRLGFTEVRGGHPLANRSGNEKIILQLIREIGPMPKAEIARSVNLSAQAVSVIINRLLSLGLVEKQKSQKGKVGQPSTPIALAPLGALSVGVKIGRQSTQVLLVDFVGNLLAERQVSYEAPIISDVLSAVEAMAAAVTSVVSDTIAQRIVGIGIAQPFRLDEWADELGIDQSVLDAWAQIDIGSELNIRLKHPAYSINDATAACLAEMVSNTKPARSSFLHIYVGTFVGGGLVIDGRLHQGNHGNAAALGSQLVCVRGSQKPQQLISVASRFHLERDLNAEGIDISSEDAAQSDVFRNWLDGASNALAQTIIGSTALVELDAVIIDSSMPMPLIDKLITSTRQAIVELKNTGINLPTIEAGSYGAIGSSFGGAMLPICSEFTLMNA